MKAQQILIAGPYRSGTDGDPQRIAANLARLEQAALAVYLRGHVPVIGEWLALPLAAAAGSTQVGDAVSEAFLYPVAHRLIAQCQAVYRIEGASAGADNDVRLANEWGLTVYRRLEEIPPVQE
ncbi:NUDIX hydrolase [Serratia marcescens]|uniref:NUDIX hydrolase n=1 Tax=Serratia marcescens TaxID=615 RepID=UPI001A2A8DD6|nr:NUDIX hydrolase [Serratia marcescens]HAT3786360.1 NUDIX hydrolase [Serratia marcescens]HAT3790504.1 NUDIX hydrolase [Serratia marcescens]HAT3801620.1 NUDIX hydrolase [Serratia marcescens]HAU5715766.1 NUDIX hydrolase [Serratia marcescens]